MTRRTMLHIEVDTDTDIGFITMGRPHNDELHETPTKSSQEAILMGFEILAAMVQLGAAMEEEEPTWQ